VNAKQFSLLLRKIGACEDASVWAKGKSLQEAWDSCERGDWLLWLCGKMADKKGWPTRKQVVLAAVECAEPALKYVRQGENRPAECLRIVREWCAGNASIEQVREARNAAYAAAYAAADAAVYDAADDAADAAAYAAVYDAADAAADAYAAADAAYAAARNKSLKESADKVRSILTPHISCLQQSYKVSA